MKYEKDLLETEGSKWRNYLDKSGFKEIDAMDVDYCTSIKDQNGRDDDNYFYELLENKD